MRAWRRLLLVVVTMLTTAPLSGAVASEPSSAHQPVASSRVAPEVLVIGVPGLRWQDISASATPTLWKFAGQAARGALSVRSETERTCPDAGWLTLGAGARAADLGRGCDRRATLADWDVLRQANSEALDSRKIGALGAALRDAGSCARADEHAALAVGPGGAREVCPVVLVELPPDLEAADTAMDTLLRSDAGRTVLLVGLSEAGSTDRPHLHVLAIRGPTFSAGAELTSASTSRLLYVQLIDVAPTILTLLRHEVPKSMSGRPMTTHIGYRSLVADVRRLADLDRRAGAQRAAVVPFTVLLVLALLVLVAVALRGVRRRWLEVAVVVVMAMPVASFLAQLVPWWRAGGLRFGALLAVCLALASLLAVVALPGPWRARRFGPVAVVAVVTVGVLALDLMTGAHLQMDAVFGYSPYVAGRFVGIGNPGFAVFGSAAVLTAALLIPPGRRAWLGVAALGLIAVAVDGAPPWGDDFGGVLALVPAFVVVASLLTSGAVRWSRLLLAAVAGVVLVTGFALADYARGERHRTHLGRFVEQVRDGTAGQVIHRKAQANLDLLTHSPFTLLVPLLLAAAIWLLLRPPAAVARRLAGAPDARAALLGVLTLSIVGGLVNDSGTAIPAVALLLAVPVAIVLGVSEAEATEGA